MFIVTEKILNISFVHQCKFANMQMCGVSRVLILRATNIAILLLCIEVFLHFNDVTVTCVIRRRLTRQLHGLL